MVTMPAVLISPNSFPSFGFTVKYHSSFWEVALDGTVGSSL